MKRERFSESEMVKTVKRLEAGESPMSLCKELGIGKTTLYKWKSRYSGMEVSQVKRLKELEEENRRLKRMYADLSLDHELLKEVLEKNFRARVKRGTGDRDSHGAQASEHHSGVPRHAAPQVALLLCQPQGRKRPGSHGSHPHGK